MKNIHIIPTYKPSRLGRFVDTNNLFLRIPNDIPRGINVNIYITSDEEIKEGDWCLSKLNEVVRFGKNFTLSLYKKIILTTAQDLIKKGVQPIDDTFLEWFVKNQSCERVEVESMINMVQFTPREFIYKIIIPQETLEEAARNYNTVILGNGRETIKQAFIAGAKWQAEKMYSEEDMKKAIRFGFDKGFCSNSSNKTKNLGLSEEEWFEQFKKKSVV